MTITQDFEITKENWQTARYKAKELLAFISFGATVEATTNECKALYYVIVSDLDYNEISESSFSDLDEALESLNDRFKHWELTNLSSPSTSGCDSCSAH